MDLDFKTVGPWDSLNELIGIAEWMSLYAWPCRYMNVFVVSF